MTRPLIALLAALILALPACRTEEEALAGFAGAAIGAITAEALLDDDRWTVLGALAGAAAGTLVAREAAGTRCAYATGRGTYVVRRCP